VPGSARRALAKVDGMSDVVLERGRRLGEQVEIGRTPTRIELLVPDDDVAEPVVSIVVPALNESVTVETFVRWCHEGLAAAGVRGEILIIDSSDDDTPQLAVASGARVLRVPKRGLGRAYIDAVPYIRGEFVIMGDADCTYDFRQLAPFVERFREGYEYVMGSRWAGSIEKGSMPPHHQYFGTPFTTWILNRLYRSTFTDIHCGMRGITLEALRRMELQSQSWEYASEMVLKSVHMELRTAEVPVHFLKDRDGRVSHHRRAGWFSPFAAAWINLRAMFVYGADFFIYRPGIVIMAIGTVLMMPFAGGPVRLGSVTFSLYWQFLGGALAVIGLNGYLMGCLAQIFFDYTGKRTAKVLDTFRYTRSLVVAMITMAVGVGLMVPLVARYLGDGLRLDRFTSANYLFLSGIYFVIFGFSIFAFTLLMHAAATACRSMTWRRRC
jgi:glycosyltransferase involved in cell wall biosynthesis